MTKGKVILDDGHVGFDCPGCRLYHRLRVRPAPSPSWDFNGDVEIPTLSPSILARWSHWEPPVTADNLDDFKRAPWPQTKVERVCHSFVTDGRIQFLPDSTHALAGQTVDLPDMED